MKVYKVQYADKNNSSCIGMGYVRAETKEQALTLATDSLDDIYIVTDITETNNKKLNAPYVWTESSDQNRPKQ